MLLWNLILIVTLLRLKYSFLFFSCFNSTRVFLIFFSWKNWGIWSRPIFYNIFHEGRESHILVVPTIPLPLDEYFKICYCFYWYFWKREARRGRERLLPAQPLVGTEPWLGIGSATSHCMGRCATNTSRAGWVCKKFPITRLQMAYS